ncbi:hypothetical protein ES702_03924 [subsurface metagenome]
MIIQKNLEDEYAILYDKNGNVRWVRNGWIGLIRQKKIKKDERK